MSFLSNVESILEQETNNVLAHFPFSLAVIFLSFNTIQLWIEESLGTLYNAQLSAKDVNLVLNSLWPLRVSVTQPFLILAITLLVLPVVYVSVRVVIYYLIHPNLALAGKKPPYKPLLSFEWMFTGVAINILPLSVYNVGVWLISLAVSIGVVAIPYILGLSREWKLAAYAISVISFVYFHMGAEIHEYIPIIPNPVTLWPSVIGISMTPQIAHQLEGLFNSLVFGPIITIAFALLFMFISTERVIEHIDGTVVTESYATVVYSSVMGAYVAIAIHAIIA